MEVIAKPRIEVRGFLHNSAVVLIDAVRSASVAEPRKRMPRMQPQSKAHGRRGASRSSAPLEFTTDKVMHDGESTGGTEALTWILSSLPPDAPPIVVVRRMPEVFTATLRAAAQQPLPNRGEGSRGRRQVVRWPCADCSR